MGRAPKLKLVTVSIAIGGLIAVGVMLGSSHSSAWFAVAVGVLGSLVASIYALWVNILVFGERGDDSGKAAQVMASLERAVPLVRDAVEHRVAAVQPKSAYRPADWLALLHGADKELYIVGHALHKWCRDDVKETFVATIRRVTKHEDGAVHLLMPDPNSEITRQICDQRGKDYPRWIEETVVVLAKIYADLPNGQKPRLDVRMLAENTPMPYVLAGNEHELISAPYPVAADSDTMPAIRVHVASALGAALRNDLQQLIGIYSDAVDLGAI